jgi:hypothetical protein
MKALRLPPYGAVCRRSQDHFSFEAPGHDSAQQNTRPYSRRTRRRFFSCVLFGQPERLDALYAPEAYFKDPFNEVYLFQLSGV